MDRNSFRKTLSFMVIVTLVAVATGFCSVSTSLAATISDDNNGHGEMPINGDHDGGGRGVKSCCFDTSGLIVNNSDNLTKNAVKFSMSAISVADASLVKLNFVGDGVIVLSKSPPPKGDLLSSVIKKE